MGELAEAVGSLPALPLALAAVAALGAGWGLMLWDHGFAAEAKVCSRCFVRLTRTRRLWIRVHCRACGQRFGPLAQGGEPPYLGVRAIVVRVDEHGRDPGPKARRSECGLDLLVRWNPGEPLVDLDRLEIVSASGRTLEQIAIACGNDPDALREARYREVPVVVGAGVELDPNARWSLEQVFAGVEQVADGDPA